MTGTNKGSEKNRWERKKEKTSQKIIEVAMELFKKQGIEATTMEQIAEEADIAKGTLYNHFSVKEAIISSYVQLTIKSRESELHSIITQYPDTRSRLIALFIKVFEWNRLNKDILLVYNTFRMSNLLESIKDPNKRSGFEIILAKIVKYGQETGEIREDISTKMLARHLELMVVIPFIGWLVSDQEDSAMESLEETIEIFLNGAKLTSI